MSKKDEFLRAAQHPCALLPSRCGWVIVTNLLIFRQLYLGAKVRRFLITHKKKDENFRGASNQVAPSQSQPASAKL